MHPDVASVTITTPRDVRTLVPTSDHAIIAVYDGLFPGGTATATATIEGRPRGHAHAARRVTGVGLQEELIAALAADRVTAGADERRRHGSDEGWHAPAPPDFVVYPASTEEAAAVVRLLPEHGTPIVPFGAGTSLEGHVAGARGRRQRRHDAGRTRSCG